LNDHLNDAKQVGQTLHPTHSPAAPDKGSLEDKDIEETGEAGKASKEQVCWTDAFDAAQVNYFEMLREIGDDDAEEERKCQCDIANLVSCLAIDFQSHSAVNKDWRLVYARGVKRDTEPGQGL
jgi:hypothetical protein